MKYVFVITGKYYHDVLAVCFSENLVVKTINRLKLIFPENVFTYTSIPLISSEEEIKEMIKSDII